MATKPAAAPLGTILRDIEAYLTRYVTFSEPDAYPFALALWCAATHLWPHFDAFAYLSITSDTKRSGKTRLSELLSFVVANARRATSATPATVFHWIRDESPVLFIDEAESMNSESADTMREVLNSGYRRGQTIPRMKNGKVEEWPAYCPKAFVLIGDVRDTLRDRSIIIRMQRGTPRERFLFLPAENDGNALRDLCHDLLTQHRDDIIDAYMTHAGLSFLGDRDEEIWMPLFAVASVLCPERLDELTRVAVDMSTEKTVQARRYSDSAEAEKEANEQEYRDRLLSDAQIVFAGSKHKNMLTAELLAALRDLLTGPWRKYKGEGLSALDMAGLLDSFGIHPRVVRAAKGRGAKVGRGYRKADIDAAAKQLKH